MGLQDFIPDKVMLLICGTAVTKTSKRANAYYANRGNNIYQTLHVTGLTPHQVTPDEYRTLASYGIGFTDLVKAKTGLDKELSKSDFDIDGFKMKILNAKPRVICFNGKKAAAMYLGIRSTKDVSYGLQKDRIGGTQVFVAPSTGAQARKFWDIKFWHKLKTLLENDHE